MNNREIYVCVRFSDKASMKIDDKSFSSFVEKLKKEMLPKLTEQFRKIDKNVKVWVATE